MVAGARAIESGREDAFVRDPFAERLAGEHGMALFRAVPHPEMMGFGLALRGRFVDELLLESVASGRVNTVVSLGAGLDSRPWRLELPPELRWVEVDFPAMLEYKEAIMAGETPRCRRERLTADLNDPVQRRAIYRVAGKEPALMITEGLLMYLPAGTVESIAREARAESAVEVWISDVTTSSFGRAIDGNSKRVVGHVQADDYLEGEDILKTIYQAGWNTEVKRSYITDLAFAKDRIARMMSGALQPPTPPPFEPNDPSGVHQFARE